MTLRRTCTRCGQPRPISEFRIAGNRRYLRRICKLCESRAGSVRYHRRKGLAIPERLLPPTVPSDLLIRVRAERMRERGEGRIDPRDVDVEGG